jgi:multidrug efflux pump subunit AcrB
MRSFINYFIKYPIAANLLMFAILLIGVIGGTLMKSTFFPENPSRNIAIQIVFPGASPEEIEEGVITKIEENLKGVTGVERVTSVSSENSGSINVEVMRGKNTDLILQDVKNAVDQINSFPVDMEPPVVFKVENLELSASFAISGEVDLRTLKRFARQAEDDLLAMDGISKVGITGYPAEEIEIAFRENDLRAYNLTFAQAAQAVRAANIEVTGGTVKAPNEELLVRARSKEYYADGLRDIVVKTNAEGSVVRLFQIATIRDQWEDNPNRNFLNGESAVVISVSSTVEEDILDIRNKVMDYIDDFNERNTVVKAEVIRDRTISLRQRINLLGENGLIGFIIVSLLLAVFLHWRLALWVAIAIPISFAGMFLFAYLLDVTINVISLFGMILVIGILVDDGIVISESIYQEYEKGVPRLKAAIEGTMKVLPAVFSAIVTTVIAFSAFYFIDGRLGDFFSEMSTVVILSLVFSLVEGALILPTHVAHSKALAPNRKDNAITKAFDRLMRFLRDKLYAPGLRFCMQYKWLIVSFVVGLLFMTFGALQGGHIKGTFFPVIERDDFTVTLQMPAGTREHITEKWLDHIEAAAWEANEELSDRFFNNEKSAIERVQKIVGVTGQGNQSDGVGGATYKGQLIISVLEGEARDSLTVRDVINAVRKKAGPVYEAEVLTYGAATPFGKPISISLVGNNYEELDEATLKVKTELAELVELTDVVDNNQEGLREINLKLKDKARYLGLNLAEVVGQVRSGFFGNEVQRLQRGRDEVRVWVRYAEEDRQSIDQLKNMRVRFADGREFPLAEIAELEVKRGIIAINHIDGKREVKVEADVVDDQVSVSSITASIKEGIVPAVLANYPSVRALYEGQNREQEKTTKSMQVILPVIGLLMFFTIALTFRSISQTLIVFALIPFGFIGAAWGHYFMGLQMSLLSILGIIALVGILVNDALVFITTYNNLIEEEVDQMDAVYQAGISRFRPILLTSVTTVAGLLPLLGEKSLQAQFLIPMAASVAFGLLVITFIILGLLPILLIITNRIKVYAVFAWEGVKPNLESVEPAMAGRKSYFFLWLVAGVLSTAIFVGLIRGLMAIAEMIV